MLMAYYFAPIQPAPISHRPVPLVLALLLPATIFIAGTAVAFPEPRREAPTPEPRQEAPAPGSQQDETSTDGLGGEQSDDAPFRFGEWAMTIDGLTDPAAVAVGPDGSIAIAESGAGQIRIRDRVGDPAGTIGSPGSESGELLRPSAVAFDDAGTIFISDAGNHRVQLFSADGTALRHFGSYGAAAGEFNEPRGIAIDDGKIYVADLGNHRVQIFDLQGRHIDSFGSFGRTEGQFNRPLDVALDPEGFIYVSDSDNNRIQKFTTGGEFVKSWGDFGPFAGLMNQPSGVAFRDGALYVADTRNHRVQIFDREGNLLEQWGTHAVLPHEGEGALHYPTDLAIGPGGDYAIICETFENRCQIFAARAPGLAPPPPAAIARRAQAHFGEHLDADGKLMAIAEPDSHRLFVFEMSRDIPIVIGDFGERGEGFGQMIRIAGIDLDLNERLLLVSDAATRRINAFQINWEPDEPRGYSAKRGGFSQAFDLPRLASDSEEVKTTWVIEPEAIARDGDGNLYVADPRNSMIFVFDSELGVQRAWGGYGSEPGRFRAVTDLAFGPDGEELFVVDADNRRVQVFDRSGGFQRAIEGGGQEAGEGGRFQQPFGIAVSDAFVFVTDSAAHRVLKFTTEGAFVSSFGEFGTDHGQFWKPKGIVQDERGRLIVSDYGNHRAQIFSTDGEWLVTFGTGRAYTRWDRR